MELPRNHLSLLAEETQVALAALVDLVDPAVLADLVDPAVLADLEILAVLVAHQSHLHHAEYAASFTTRCHAHIICWFSGQHLQRPALQRLLRPRRRRKKTS